TFRLRLRQNFEDVEWEFKNEIQVMKQISPHHHIISLIASYVCGRDLGMILEPVADGGSLDQILRIQHTRVDLEDTMRTILLRLFGCLADALAFVHKSRIRHKDLKPENILLHRGKPILADFGVAFNGLNAETLTTEGVAYGFSRRYCAPEVVKHGPRNQSSDVFSLGAVFVEIMSAIEENPYQDLLRPCYAENIENILPTLEPTSMHWSNYRTFPTIATASQTSSATVARVFDASGHKLPNPLLRQLRVFWDTVLSCRQPRLHWRVL
ncbi:hypothetical protein LTR66_008528, partial [Elasticomyces elasticus]